MIKFTNALEKDLGGSLKGQNMKKYANFLNAQAGDGSTVGFTEKDYKLITTITPIPEFNEHQALMNKEVFAFAKEKKYQLEFNSIADMDTAVNSQFWNNNK